MKIISLKYLFAISTFLLVVGAKGQQTHKGVSLQGIIKQDDNLLSNQLLYFRMGLYSDTTATPLWEELQDTTTNAFALFNIYLGTGTSTGGGLTDNFNEVNWTDPIWLKIEYKLFASDVFILLGTRKFQSIPFVMHAEYATGVDVGFKDLFDVDDSLQVDYMLKWDGEKWISSTDAIYAWNTVNANISNNSDTSLFAWSIINPPPADTVSFSYFSDSTYHSVHTDSTDYSISSILSDTSEYAFDIINSWSIYGNSNENYLGTLDSVNLVIKTNNTNRIRIQENGEVLINESNDFQADLQTLGTIVFKGFHQSFSFDSTLNNIFYWEPKKSSLVIGNEMTPYFVDTLGRYSMAGGINSLANSYSFAWGDSCIASGNNVVVFGKNNTSSPIGLNKNASGVVMGLNNETLIKRCVALGNNNSIKGGGNANVAIGSNNIITLGQGATAIGNHIENNGHSEIMIGNYLFTNSISASSNCILLGDHSTTTYLDNIGSPKYQMLMRFDGGVEIYSDSLTSTGVALLSGSGSWSMLSDRNSKENISIYKWTSSVFKNERIFNIYKWNYKSQSDKIKHIGAFAQDFNNTFALNEAHNRINMIDMDGVTFSGIKYLFEKMEEDKASLKKIEKRLKAINTEQLQLLEILNLLESRKEE